MKEPKMEAPARQDAAWRRWVERPLVICGAALVFVLMGLSFSDALLRSLFNMPIFGANDYAQILLSFAVAISMPLCVISGRLIAIDTITDMLPERAQIFLDWLTTLMGVVILAYLAWRAYSNALEAASFGESTLLLQLPFGPSYYAVAAGSALSAILLLVERLVR
ncbi:TRAP transporter small permease [Maritalea mediterranea]|uniref:TRAP transporter small permease protein n=1 Tax=Maritalea mediterranea TaxID=2909667 RepID=A0ABS9E3E0_9HYPH|nr:TRAP transporter small permease [Maritalea mediterranea]MCF4097390.1 TRAP transporter small permease [Maritalea mediterranea]